MRQAIFGAAFLVLTLAGCLSHGISDGNGNLEVSMAESDRGAVETAEREIANTPYSSIKLGTTREQMLLLMGLPEITCATGAERYVYNRGEEASFTVTFSGGRANSISGRFRTSSLEVSVNMAWSLYLPGDIGPQRLWVGMDRGQITSQLGELQQSGVAGVLTCKKHDSHTLHFEFDALGKLVRAWGIIVDETSATIVEVKEPRHYGLTKSGH